MTFFRPFSPELRVSCVNVSALSFPLAGIVVNTIFNTTREIPGQKTENVEHGKGHAVYRRVGQRSIVLTN
jgi:hypothetical protein